MVASAGLRITSEAGTTQITNQAVTFGQSGYGSVTLTDDGQAHPQPIMAGSVTVSGTNPTVCIRTPGVPVCLVGISPQGNGTTIFRFISPSAVPVTFDYWSFDTATSALKQDMGGAVFRVYDEQGVLTFDAAMPVMRIVDKISMAMPSNQGGGDRLYEIKAVYNVPAGKTYAAIPTSQGGVQVMWDTGQYATGGQQPGGLTEPEDPNNPDPTFTWKRMRLESYVTTVKTLSATQIEVGLSRIEIFEGWYPIQQAEKFVSYGTMNFRILDVTNYPSSNSGGVPPTLDYTPAPVDWPDMSVSSPNPTVGYNGAARTLTSFNTIIRLRITISQITQNSAENTGLFCVNGTVIVGSIGMANGGSFEFNASPGDAIYFYMECGTSAGTRSASFTVTVTNVSASYVMDSFVCTMVVDNDNNHNVADNTPDAISIAEQYIATNENYAQIGIYRTLIGFNQTITIRVTTSDVSGNISAGGAYFQKNGVNHPSGVMLWTGAPSVSQEWAVNPGDQLGLVLDAQTFSGRKQGRFLTTITNVNTGAVMAQFWTNADVDQNNDYLNDYTPDVITNWPTLNVSSNEPAFTVTTTSYGEHTITGINQPITIRFERYNYVGNLDALYFDCFTLPPGAGAYTHHGYFAAHESGPRYLDVPNVVNGTRVAINPQAISNMGRRSATFDMVVWSLSSTTTFASSTGNSMVADADDNYLTEDYTPDALSLNNISLYTNEASGYTSDCQFRVLGINRTINLRFTRGNQWDSGGIFTRRLYIYHSTNGSTWTEYFIGAGAVAEANISVNNGDFIVLRAFMDTSMGRGETSFNAFITNTTTGASLGSILVSGVVDADNNYNMPDYTPDAFGLPTISVYSNADYVVDSSGQAGQTLVGFNQQITLRLVMAGVSGSMNGGRFRLIRYTPSIGWHEAGSIPLSNGGGSVSANFLPGDSVYTDVYETQTFSGRKDMSFTGQLFNDSAGGYLITQHAVNLTVDADNNFYDRTPDPLYLTNMSYSSTNGYGGASQSFYVSGIGINVTLSVQITNVANGFTDGYFYVLDGASNIITSIHYPDGPGSTSFTVSNNTWYQFYTDGASIRQRQATFNVAVYNQDTGALLNQFTVSGSVVTQGGGGGDPT